MWNTIGLRTINRSPVAPEKKVCNEADHDTVGRRSGWGQGEGSRCRIHPMYYQHSRYLGILQSLEVDHNTSYLGRYMEIARATIYIGVFCDLKPQKSGEVQCFMRKIACGLSYIKSTHFLDSRNHSFDA